ncbi:MAG: hypothetical protein FWF08_01905 [Oscillospiraceae bacterium]|nr:hypothetical protein [Oscillospiraceae bacterium]
MGLFLMCKDVAVLNISGMKVFNRNLLPGLLSENQNETVFMDWFHKRYSERSNTASRQLRGVLFGQGNREVIDRTTHALSLSDCYWIKSDDEDVTFSEISPYYNDFWQGEGEYAGEAIPTLYVNGYLTKYWRDKDTLIKRSDKKEILCSKIAETLGISTVEIYEHDDGIAVKNFTSDKIMFEPAEASGRIDAESFSNEDILRVFGERGFDMLFLDALTGNGDRHAGNFGFLRGADMGEYVGMAPLFDYDHAYDSNNDDDILIREIKALKSGEWRDRLHELAEKAKSVQFLDDYMRNRLENIL